MSEMNEKDMNEVNAEAPKVEEPKAEEPKAAEPAIEEPVAEEPKAEEPTLTAELVPETPAAPPKKTSGLATAGMIIGIISAATSIIPFMNVYSIVGGILAMVFGIICLCKKASKGKAVGALITGIAAILVSIFVLTLTLLGIFVLANEVADDMISEEVSVTFGQFTVTESTMWTTTGLEIVVKNIDDEMQSYSVTVEAVDQDGNRLEIDTVKVYDLRPGQSQKFQVFTDVALEDVDAMKTATFRVLKSVVIYGEYDD